MNVQKMTVTQADALAALRQYKEHRAVYDTKDWEIERVYRQIAKGKTVISVTDAIRRAGLDAQQRPVLAIARADCPTVDCYWNGRDFSFTDRHPSKRWCFRVSFQGVTINWWRGAAKIPRIPPQHRPKASTLSAYHILWEADWTDIPRDPYLLKRIGKDAWVVLAAWDLTEVELSVLRAHK